MKCNHDDDLLNDSCCFRTQQWKIRVKQLITQRAKQRRKSPKEPQSVWNVKLAARELVFRHTSKHFHKIFSKTLNIPLNSKLKSLTIRMKKKHNKQNVEKVHAASISFVHQSNCIFFFAVGKPRAQVSVCLSNSNGFTSTVGERWVMLGRNTS
jgi:predicted secreted Zn-dependent protease